MTDAYGGTGGIALYNRDVLEAMCEDVTVKSVICVPRVIAAPMQPMPEKLLFDTAAANGTFAYVKALLRHLRGDTKFDLIYCAHVNLIPLARIAGLIARVPWVLCIYGTEAWSPPARLLSRQWAAKAHRVLSISQITLERFRSWCPVANDKCNIVPNALHLDRYPPLPKDLALVERYGLSGRKVIMTLGRLDPIELAKGFDRVVRVLPDLLRDIPNITYLIVGSGGDRPRLEALANSLGVGDAVVFTGFVSEADKPKLYAIADAYVMPSTGEGFGFVFLEAIASGLPVIASSIDGGREALLGGELGWLVDPSDPIQIRTAIIEALATHKSVPQKLAYFSFQQFQLRVLDAIRPNARCA